MRHVRLQKVGELWLFSLVGPDAKGLELILNVFREHGPRGCQELCCFLLYFVLLQWLELGEPGWWFWPLTCRVHQSLASGSSLAFTFAKMTAHGVPPIAAIATSETQL